MKPKTDHLVCPKCQAPTRPVTKFYGGGLIVTWKCTADNCKGKHEEDLKK